MIVYGQYRLRWNEELYQDNEFMDGIYMEAKIKVLWAPVQNGWI